MMPAVTQTELDALYFGGDDPWAFRTSAYERAKFAATAAALSRPAYYHALEIGCGNGELALRLAPRCARYTGVDGAAVAVAAARRAVPRARFHQLYLPHELPDGNYDLLILSEVLYFLDAGGIASLARQIRWRWPVAETVVVTWLGPTGATNGGEAALETFAAAMGPGVGFAKVADADGYRIDRAVR